MLSRDSEDEFDQDLCLNFVIWPQEVTLIRWTRPSGPLCLWQCSICSLLPLLVVIFWHLRKKRSLEFFQKELLKSQSNLNTIVHGFEMIGFTFVPCCPKLLCIFIKNSAKGTTDPWVKFTSQILIKLQFRNLDQALTLKSQPKISISTKLKLEILTKPSFIILTKIQLRNLNQTSAAKYWPNFSFKISPEFQLQTPDQTLCWKHEEKFSFFDKTSVSKSATNCCQHDSHH